MASESRAPSGRAQAVRFALARLASGVGHVRTPPVSMQAGDVVEIEIDGLGVLRNPVVAEGR